MENLYDYMNGIAGIELDEDRVWNLAEYGISWCETGRDDRERPTTKCIDCQHVYDCEAVYDAAFGIAELMEEESQRDARERRVG